MTDTNDLIKRARKLAVLADKATPGPWGVDAIGDDRFWIVARRFWVITETLRNKYRLEYPYGYRDDAELMAAAPDMAKLLREMADALEARITEEEVTDE